MKKKLKDFNGTFNPTDFADYCFYFDASDECNLYWTKSKLSAYDSFREYIEDNFWSKPYETLLMECEIKFNVGEDFFSNLFDDNSDPQEFNYILESIVFEHDADDTLISELIRRINETKMFDSAILNKSRGFFNFIYDFTDNYEEQRTIMQAFFNKERKLISVNISA